MNHGPLVYLAAFFALAASWFGFVLTPQMQVGQLQQTNAIPAEATYPVARPGLARQGLDVYRSSGCVYCHSQQIGQTGTSRQVLLTDAGTNQAALVQAILNVRQEAGQPLSEPEAKQLLLGLPKVVLQGATEEAAAVGIPLLDAFFTAATSPRVSKDTAVAAIKALAVGNAKASLWIAPLGPDIARGWGKRRTVAEDFLFDSPVMLGSQRIGPDLSDVGARKPDFNWHLLHLYAPRFQVAGSTMPPYRFLFETRRIERMPSLDALALPRELAPPAGYEVVPKPEAKALVVYLLSLRADVPLYVAPFSTAAPPETNAPPATAATNAPAK